MRWPKRVFSLLLYGSLVCAAQTKFPDTPAGHQCAAWLESFNGGERESYRDFLQKNYPSALKDLDRAMQFRQMTGGFDFRKLEESAPTKIVVLVQEHDSDQFARATVEVEVPEPH